MKEPNEEKSVSLTPNDLKEIIAAAVASAVQESRKPAPPTPVQVAQQEQELQSRRETAALQLAAIESKKMDQSICAHRHATGETHAVHVIDGNYMLCQKCQAKVRPGAAPPNYGGTDIYDTALFNHLFQDTHLADM